MKSVPHTAIHVPDDERTRWLEELSTDKYGWPIYQQDRLDAALSCCRSIRCAVDGGAHVGLWSHALALEFDKVVAVEPIFELAECLRENVRAMPNGARVQVVRKALSDTRGQLVDIVGSSRKSVAWRIAEATETVSDKLERRQVETIRIDDLGLTACDLIKLDVEGHEFAALRGAEQTLRMHRPVVILEEKHDPQTLATSFLRSLGYRTVTKKKHDVIMMYEGARYA
jgi:FkbM family methyltransferase